MKVRLTLAAALFFALTAAFIVVTQPLKAASYTVSGTVSGPLGNLPGQSIYLFGSGFSNSTTDASGFYSVDLPEGQYSLSMYNNNYAEPMPGMSSGYSFSANSLLNITQNTTLNLPLPFKKIDVHLIGSDSNPVGQVDLYANAYYIDNLTVGSLSGYASCYWQWHTDVNGFATLWLLPGTYSFSLNPVGNYPPAYQTVVVSEDMSWDFTLTAVKVVTLNGKVTGWNGEVVPELNLQFSNQTLMRTYQPVISSDGSYSLEVAEGEYSFSLGYSGMMSGPPQGNLPDNLSIASQSNFTIAGNTTLDLPLPIRRLETTVVGSDGPALSGVTISTMKWSWGTGLNIGQMTTSAWLSDNAVTGSDGKAVLWVLTSEANYDITATPLSLEYNAATINTSVTADTNITITLTRNKLVTISGVVKTESGATLADQSVTFSSAGDFYLPPYTTQTGPDGSFSISLKADAYSIQVSSNSWMNTPPGIPSSYGIRTQTAINFTDNTALELVLPFKKVTVHVQNPNLQPLSNVGVGFWAISNTMPLTLAGQRASGFSTSQGTTDQEGNVALWVFADPTPNSYYASINSNSPDYQSTYEWVSIPDNTNLTYTLNYQDSIPPVTIATVTPASNSFGWNNKAVTVSLAATDNLSGVTTTSYNLDNTGWQPYTVSIPIIKEGVHTLLFYSVDRAGNQEAAQTLTVRLDLTAPEAYVQFDPTNLDIAVYGLDNLSGTSAAPVAPSKVTEVKSEDGGGVDKGKVATELRTYTITDKAGNTLVLTTQVKKAGNELKVVVKSLQYNGKKAVEAPENDFSYNWTLDKAASLKELKQSFNLSLTDTKHKMEVEAQYKAKDNQTIIQVKDKKGEAKYERQGLVILKLATKNVALEVSNF
ncbi:carboxypeptidase-like regulatory domain-containing protein [Candidatus Chlorohelix sp.]|uniref:carboxypeptidase-like regulatory domain-containing protein n=1 Tax=Candidatus Chlorohelix sp. TaxID=3139201 RepID=UPI003032733C